MEEGFGKGLNGEGGRLRICHERARRLGQVWEGRGGKLTWPVETNMIWLDLEGSGVDVEELGSVAEEEGVQSFNSIRATSSRPT